MATKTKGRSPAELARESFEALFERRDFEAAREFWTEESVDHFLALGIDVRGPVKLEAFFRELFAAVPDFRMTIENIVEDWRSSARPGRRPPPGRGDHAVVQWTGTGTFNGGPFQGIEPTDRFVSLRGCDVIRFSRDGKVEENTIYYDGAEFARQIGMLPSRDSMADKGMTEALNAATRLRRRFRR
jgi:steroid delta-isomerase-like uncharacterized protein